MNREIKRQMKRDQKSAQKAQKATRRAVPPPGTRERVGMRQFIKEIQAEMRRVIWPTRGEVITYSGVVLFVIVTLMGLVFVLDLGFSKGILFLVKPGK